MTNLDFPYRFDGNGLTAQSAADDHVRDLVEQVLFTSPGERVNRPTFGAGLLKLVFEPNGEALAAVARAAAQGALQQWLGDVIAVQAVEVTAADEKIQVRVSYVVRRTRVARVDEFTRPAP